MSTLHLVCLGVCKPSSLSRFSPSHPFSDRQIATAAPAHTPLGEKKAAGGATSEPLLGVSRTFLPERVPEVLAAFLSTCREIRAALRNLVAAELTAPTGALSARPPLAPARPSHLSPRPRPFRARARPLPPPPRTSSIRPPPLPPSLQPSLHSTSVASLSPAHLAS